MPPTLLMFVLSTRRIAGQVDRVGHARYLRGRFCSSREQLGRCGRGGAVGQLGIEDQIALVLLGNEADGHDSEAEVGQSHQAAINEQRDRTHAKQAGDQSAVDVDGDVEEPIECRERMRPAVD